MQRSRSLRLIGLLAFAASLVFGQGGGGTITGTVTDPSGLVIAGANVEAKNADTGAAYTAATTTAGNYALPNLPIGTYTVTVTVAGFKTYTHENLAVQATQVIRENVALQVGTSTESVTVSAEASLLKTESGELTHNITIEQMDNLPMLGIGTANSGTSGYRNPYNTLETLPGVSNYATSGLFQVNGLGGSVPGSPFTVALSETMRIDGMDSTSRIFGNYDYTQMAQPNADAIQEIAYQTSNYAPEFGQAGSVVINMTTKSGTNQYHGSGFEYFVNEDLNAGDPFSSNGDGGKVRPRNRRNDFGGTLGGPVSIPKLYNGKNKTFFFFAYEQYLEGSQYNFQDTVPTAAYRAGNFGAISPNGNCALCGAQGIPTGPLGGPGYTDALGRPMYANTVYDPLTRAVNPANGLGYANPFPGNMIPASRINPTSLAFQNLFPGAQNGNLVSNYNGSIAGGRYSAIPSIKVDQVISDKDKISFYWSRNNTESQISSPLGNADGLPTEIGGYRGTFIPNWESRINYDRTLSPTLLLHLGAGYFHTSFSDRAPFLDFNPSQFGLSNFLQNRQFPSVTGMCGQLSGPGVSPACIQGTATAFGNTISGYGGMQNIGTSGQIQSLNYEEKPTFNANATWVHGNHTFKAGAEVYLEQVFTGRYSGVTLATGYGATAQPFINTTSFNGYNQGFGYASFLLGDYNSTTQTPAEFFRQGNQEWGLFLQDSWKVTSKLTVNYGLRWDYATPYQEQYGRLGQFAPGLANANAGGLPGATQYASTCNCNFYQPTYPFALGPRLGVAYQVTPTTVIRGGWGVNYQFISSAAGQTIGTNGVYPLAGINPYVNIATPGSIVRPTWPVTNPNIYPVPGTVGIPNVSDPWAPDQNQNRPPRITQYSIGIQQQITNNFVVEASYVGNTAVWLGSGPLGTLGGTGVNTTGAAQISPQTFAANGLFPYPGTGPCGTGGGVCKSSTYNNLADYQLLLSPINSSGVINAMAKRGVTKLAPYAGFPLTNSLMSTMYPFPQFGGLTDQLSPTGDSKYDSLQIKATKRFSHGFQAGGSYTWAQGFVRPARQDFFNPASSVWQLQQIPPQDINFNALYTVQKFNALNRWENLAVKDWQIGWFANYQSGMFLTPPVSPTFNLLQSEDIRVAGQPLYGPGVSINNLGTYNPYYTQVLNPNAWAPCPSNAACASTSVYYKDFRAPRTPSENMNIGRNFRVGKDGKYNLYIRAEFVNIFNRTLMPPPSTINPQNPAVRGAGNGTIYTGGFGTINAYLPVGSIYPATNYLQPRTGTLIARFSF